MPAAVWLQPLATVLGALIVGLAAVLTLRQRRAADDAALGLERDVLAHQREVDRRHQWWLRAQWAIDKSLSTDTAARELGVGALEVLAGEPADHADLAVLLVAARSAVDTTAGPADTGPGPDAEGAPGGAWRGP